MKKERIARKEPTLPERLYLVEILRGLWLTGARFFRNLLVHTGRAVGLVKKGRGAVTIQYPEERRPIPPGYRARHRLLRREDGSPKCVACMMCPTICPAKCIHIRAAESPDPAIEKYPVEFTIVLDRCVMCGLCVEACPVDAIRMDTGVVEMSARNREEFVTSIDFLLDSKPAKPPEVGREQMGDPQMFSTASRELK